MQKACAMRVPKAWNAYAATEGIGCMSLIGVLDAPCHDINQLQILQSWLWREAVFARTSQRLLTQDTCLFQRPLQYGSHGCSVSEHNGEMRYIALCSFLGWAAFQQSHIAFASWWRVQRWAQLRLVIRLRRKLEQLPTLAGTVRILQRFV